MIFVTTGTHHQPFERLIAAARALPEPVRIQAGEVLPPSEWERAVDEARIVVCHAAPATIEAVVARGKVPIAVPRRRLWREHVDDHQVRYARLIEDRVHVLYDPAKLARAVEAHAEVVAGLRSRWVPGVNPAWITALRT